MQAHFFQIAPTRKALTGGIDQKQTHTTRTRIGLGFSSDQQQVRQLTVGNKYFLTLNQVTPIVWRGTGADICQIAARARFSHSNARDHLTFGHAR